MPPLDFQSGDSVLVVVEGSAATPLWPPHLGDAPAQGWAVVEQEEWESSDAFLGRVSRIFEHGRSHAGPRQIVALVAGSWTDDRALADRDRLATEIAAQLAFGGSGTFVLTHGALQDARLRTELTGLAADLADEYDDPRLVARTWFALPARAAAPRKASEPPRVHAFEQLAAAR